MKRKWTRGEKWLWAAPILVAVFGAGATWGPKLARKSLGLPRKLEIPKGRLLSHLALSPDGQTLAASGAVSVAPYRSGEIYFWDAQTLKSRPTWPVDFSAPNAGSETGKVSQMAFSPDGKTLVFGRMLAPFRAVDLASRRVKWKFGRASSSDCVRFSPDGRFVCLPEDVPISRAMKIQKRPFTSAYTILDAQSGRKLGAWVVDPWRGDMNFSPDRKTLASIGSQPDAPSEQRWYGSEGRKIEFRRVPDGKLISTLAVPRTNALFFSPDGTRLLTVSEARHLPSGGTSFNGQKVSCFDVVSKQLLWTYGGEKGDFCDAAAWSPDGKTVVIAQKANNRMLLLDAQNGAIGRTLRMGEDSHIIIDFNALAFAPDGKRLFARGKSAVLVWDLD